MPPSLLTAVFDAPTRAAVAILWFIGAAFATSASALALTRPAAGPYAAFLIVAVALIFIAVALLRSWMWAMAVSLVLLCGQIIGVVGTMFQLLYGVDARKAAELHAFGLDPKIGVAVNFAFSLAATCVLVTAIFRAAKRSRTVNSSEMEHRG